MMIAEIITTGTELLLGQIVNTNARFLSEKLAEKGIDVYWQTVVGDNPARLEEALSRAISRSDIIIGTGGLGPTSDDLTKEILAKILALPLVINSTWQKNMEEMFRQRGLEMTANNLKQALLPQGARLLYNDFGTAPGIWLEHQDKIIILLPGPPREMEPMFTEIVLPFLPATGSVLLSRILKVTGIGEAAMEEKIADLISSQINPTIAPLARANELHLRLTAKAETKERCLELLAKTEKDLVERLGSCIYARDNETMAGVVAKMLLVQKKTLACAESCTGGLLSHKLTQIPGSSAYFLQGLVTYSNEAKISLLGIPAEIIERYGPVSEEVAVKMACGARKLAKSDFGLAVTGIAGPSGGSKEKPVGLVYIALSDKKAFTVKKFIFPGKRENIKERAATSALNILRLHLMQKNG